MSGVAFSQLIIFFSSPILSRMYTPEQFGVFAVFLSLVQIISVFGSLRYEVAIFLPKEEGDAKKVFILILCLSVVVSFLVFLICIVLFNDSGFFLRIKYNSNVIFIPVGVFFFTVSVALVNWINRKRGYKKLSLAKIIQSLFTICCQLIIVYKFNSSVNGLILGNLIGFLVYNILLFSFDFRNLFAIKNIKNIKSIFQVARRYRKFPLYSTWARFVSVSNLYIAPILFGFFFTTLEVGYFSLCFRLINIPISLIATSTSQVFTRKIAEEINQNSDINILLTKTIKGLSLIGIIPFMLLSIFGQLLFSKYLGPQWQTAGLFAQILAPIFYIRLIVNPISPIFDLLNKQHLGLQLNIIILLLTLVSILIGGIYKSPIIAVTSMSILGSIGYILYLFFAYRISLKNR